MSQEDPQLVYILAASHSGSTLTAMLLNAHPDVCTVGELKMSRFSAADRYRCSCRSLLTECTFWDQVAQKMIECGIDFDPLVAHMGLSEIHGAYVRRLLRPLHRGRVLESVREIMLGVIQHPD